ncbi:MAG: type II toxin-antitoxin system VapC family toxin [Anaerolineae bacterium]|nr:type II toxin-antitoxin system VapC family toxin [Anaerolineae bacterium]
MKLLLDTHVFLWWYGERAKLSPKVLALCEDVTNDLYLSLASLWEIQIKLQIGKLKLSDPLDQILAYELHINSLKLLPIHATHIYGLANLPAHHRDPFDRILIAQAQVESLTLLTQDTLITQYPIVTIW